MLTVKKKLRGGERLGIALDTFRKSRHSRAVAVHAEQVYIVGYSELWEKGERVIFRKIREVN